MTLPPASTPVRSERVVPVRLPTPSAHEPHRTVLRWRATDLAATALFVGCALLLFRLSLFEGWAFIGDPDRLNSVLNTRLFETDAVRARGTVPTWSDQQFMGYSIVSIHWMLTGFTPVPYLLALLPRAAMVDGLAWFAALLLALTFGSAYWALGAYSRNWSARVAGALLYGLAAYTVHKLAQLDLSFAALTVTPVLVRLVRDVSRERAFRTFVALALLWAFLATFTVLQEIAYLALLFGPYALYRSIRQRDRWPVLVAGLAFVCGVLIALPRVLTVAADLPLVARTTANFQTQPVEALRYFGDGLLGRTQGENDLVRGQTINMHEGVQLLSSTLGALVAIWAGLLSRSWVMRAWGIGLVLVLSVALVAWARDYYDLIGRWTIMSRELRIILANALLIGVPLWFLTRWLANRASAPRDTSESAPAASRARAGAAAPTTTPAPATTPAADTTPAAVADGPFFLGFVVLALAAIVLPEARTVLYYGFLRIDFQHARISVAMTFPLAALAAMFLSRFAPLPTALAFGGPNATPSRIAAPAPVRWTAAGLLVGLALWLIGEAVAAAVVARFGPVLEELRPRRLLTIEAARLGASLIALTLATALLVGRARPGTAMLAGGALAGWIALESIASADFRLGGPHTRDPSPPFQAVSYLNAPPATFRVPSHRELAAVRDRLDADRYRVVLRQNRQVFPVLVEPHLAAFWDLRLVEGYSTGLPRRLGLLPWAEGVTSPHNLDLQTGHDLPWRLLAALNVKYVVEVDESFWYNPAPGGAAPPLDLATLRVLENPHPVTPRAFFTALVSPAGEGPLLAGDDGARPAPADPPIEAPAAHSMAEGVAAERRFPVEGAVAATFAGDRVHVRVDAAPADRFLVLNEMYYPAWRAWIDGRPAEIYPTNVVMRGLVVPAGATTVELRYVPFLVSPAGIGMLAAAIAATVLAAWSIRHASRRAPLASGQRAPRHPAPFRPAPTSAGQPPS